MDPDSKITSLAQVAETALVVARSGGADQAEVALSSDSGLSVTVRLGELESVEHHRDQGLAVTVYCGGRKGSASSADISAAGIQSVVERALSIATFTEIDPYTGLAPAERMAVNPPDLELAFPWALTVDEAETLAQAAEASARGFDPRISNSEGATVSSGRAMKVYANSHGFSGGYPLTSHSLSCAVVASQGGAMERDYWYSVARDPKQLMSAEALGRRAAERAVRRLNGKSVRSQAVPVVFPAEIARGLVGHLVAAIAGGAQYRKATFLLDALGEQLFPSAVSIREEPWISGAMGSVPFDNEGVATAPRALIEDGILQGYVLSSYSARRLGMESTGNAGGTHNLVVAATVDADVVGLCADLKRGFLVTELMGQGVNTVTGDYSRGAAGFWIEDGQIAYPVNEVTIAGNLREMFMGIDAIGTDVDTRSSVHIGSLRLNDMTIAGAG